MESDLEALLFLQERDQAVEAAKAELDALQPELDRLNEALQAAEELLSRAREEVDSLTEQRTELENKIDGYRVMQERKREKLEFVRGAKEASAIMAELDLARTVMAQAEAVWLKSADQLQQAELRAREVSEALDETRADQAPLRSEIEGKRTAVQVRIDAATAEREDARKSVRQDLLTRYERIKKGNARQALHGVANGACGNCFTAVPRHIQQQLRTPGTIDHCQGCGVMLYLPVS